MTGVAPEIVQAGNRQKQHRITEEESALGADKYLVEDLPMRVGYAGEAFGLRLETIAAGQHISLVAEEEWFAEGNPVVGQ